MSRNLVRHLILALLILLVAAPTASACRGADRGPSEQGAPAAARATLCLVNAERARAGLRRVRAVRRLSVVGLRHVEEMLRARYFAHTSIDGRTPIDRIVLSGYGRNPGRAVAGESLAWGRSAHDEPREVVDGWMGSPPHRRALLYPRFTEIGIAVVLGRPDGDDGATYAVELGG